MKTKHCNACNEVKDVSLFYKVGVRKDGSQRYHPSCTACVLKYNRKLYAENDEYKVKRKTRYENRSEESKIRNKENGSAFYQSVRGRALNLLKSATRRADKFPQIMDIDFDFIHNQLLTGVCSVTGLPFDLNKPEGSMKNPYAPSIDRIDPNVGYIKENTRLVIWQYNLMKGEISDAELLKLCKLIVERKENGLDI